MKRPMCWLCLLFMAGIWLGGLSGVIPVGETSGIRQVEEMLGQNGQAVIYGRIYQYNNSEQSTGICLADVYLEYQIDRNFDKNNNRKNKETMPLEQTIVYMQEEGIKNLPLGTWIQVQGRLQAIDGPGNPGEFDSQLYYRSKKIFYRMSGQKLSVCREQTWYLREWLRQFRQKLVQSLEKTVPKQAGILCAMVAGEKSMLKQEDKDLLAAGSLSHIISISGMHISLLGLLLFRAFQRLSLGILPAGVLSVGIMVCYGMMTGENVSTMRALGMFGLLMTAKIIGRSYDLLSAFSLAAIILLLDNPSCLYYSGFLLSCCCICALGVVFSQMEEITGISKCKGKLSKYLGQAVETGLAIQITTLPLVAWFYYEIPLYGILVNLLVIPTLPVVLASGFLGALAGIWQVGLAKVILIPGCLLIQFYQFLCSLVKGFPGAVLIVGQPEKWQIVLYYGILAAGLLAGKRIAERGGQKEKTQACKKWLSGSTAFLGFMCVGILLLCSHLRTCVEITCLDVGQGDGAVVCTPQGECYLIDGGSSSQKKVGQYRILPFLKSQGISKVNAVFISHTDADHINGLEEILQMIQAEQISLTIDCLVFPRLDGEDEGQQELAALAEKASATVRYMNTGDKVKGAGLSWTALSPTEGSQTDDINENSLVLLLEAGRFRGLFTGDIGEEQEQRIARCLVDCDFLKVAHHGSRYSTGNLFLEKVLPEIAVASSSATNTYGHPHPDTLKRLEESKCHVFLTKDSGAVTLKVGDGTVEVETYLN